MLIESPSKIPKQDFGIQSVNEKSVKQVQGTYSNEPQNRVNV
jgi:hypothetical protein